MTELQTPKYEHFLNTDEVKKVFKMKRLLTEPKNQKLGSWTNFFCVDSFISEKTPSDLKASAHRRHCSSRHEKVMNELALNSMAICGIITILDKSESSVNVRKDSCEKYVE